MVVKWSLTFEIKYTADKLLVGINIQHEIMQETQPLIRKVAKSEYEKPLGNKNLLQWNFWALPLKLHCIFKDGVLDIHIQ